MFLSTCKVAKGFSAQVCHQYCRLVLQMRTFGRPMCEQSTTDLAPFSSASWMDGSAPLIRCNGSTEVRRVSKTREGEGRIQREWGE